MQNKGAIWVFTVLLTLACLYQLSFSFFTSRFENKAEEYAQDQLDSLSRADGEPDLLARTTLLDQYKTEYLRRNGNEEIYPVFGYTYSEAKSKEINLGLDLAGGMSVTLEVSIPDLILALSNDADNAELQAVVARARELQRDSQDDFISLFGRAWEETQQGKQMATFFHSRENAERFPADASNGQILETLREEARVAINNTEKILRTRIDKFGVAQPTIQKQQFTGRILIELPGVKDKERVRKVIQSTANLEFWNTYENAEILPFLDEANTFLADEAGVLDADTATATGDTLLDALSTNEAADALLENVGDTTATAETDTTQSDEDLLSQLAVDSAESDLDTTASLSEEEQLARLPLFRYLNPNFFNNQVSPGPIVGFANVADTARVNALLNRDDIQDLFPEDLRLMWAARPDERISNTALALYAIKADTREGQAPLSGESIVDAAQSYDMTNQVEVTMTMDSEGARTWRRLTADAASQNPKRSIAIVLDNLVYTAPQVQGEIPGGRSSISMGTGTRNEQIEEALDLANLLKAGALPAPASIVDEAVVGPSLGQSNIDAGILSFAIALAVVMLYMILYYNSAGWVADIALVANLFFLIGALASIQASLTLPGIAGIILTIGMAVDANVLIFERVREELRSGESAKSALQKGYRMAYSAIIDSNLTTLLTAIVLVTVGTGPIKGFATTLIIGIFTSLFSALFITRLIFVSRMEKGKSFKFWSTWSEKVLLNANYQFIARRKTFYIISAVVILAGVASMFTRGFNLGVDFAGGRTYTVKFENPVQLEQVRSSLAAAFVDEAGNSVAPEVKTIGAQNQIKVTTKYLVDDDSQSADGRVEEALRGGLNGLGNAFTIEESRKVDPTISDDFQASSLTAITLSLLLIFAYIVFRFKRWQYGVGAVLSMIHDVLIVLGFYSIFWGILPFSLEIDQAFIAAILTVVGYSINDTVIVFDRIREYRKDHPTEVSESVINKALNSTLTRTINTSLTTILVLLIMFLLGGDSIRGFVFALLIGVAVGTFSSLFVAAPVVVDLDNRIKAKGDIK